MAQDDPAWPMKLFPHGPQRTPQRPEFMNIIASLRKHLHDTILGITFVINLTAVLGPVKRGEGPRIPKGSLAKMAQDGTKWARGSLQQVPTQPADGLRLPAGILFPGCVLAFGLVPAQVFVLSEAMRRCGATLHPHPLRALWTLQLLEDCL